MKIRPIYWFVGAVLFIIILLLWSTKWRAREAQTNPPSAIVTQITNGQPQPPVKSSSAVVAKLGSSNVAVPSTPIDKGLQTKEALAGHNDVDVVFYGRLLDQFGIAVSGAEIAADVRIYNDVQSTVKHLKVVSDENGFFQIQGGKGEGLGIMPKKEGYVLAMSDTYFKYSYMYPDHFSPDPMKPTVIKMWKLQGAEPLVDISKEYRLPFTGEPIHFDLTTQSVVPTGGDLEVIVTRTPGALSKKNPADWSIELKPVDGGVIETDYHTAQVTFEAPDDNYQDSYSLQMKQNDRAWSDGVDKEFFFKSRNGRVYGKFYLNFGINRNPSDPLYFQFKGVANTNGSRNWEATVSK